MNKINILLFFVCFSSFTFSQEIITEKFNLSKEISENSGLLYFNGKIITHNDSGGKACLYELDTLSGSVIRTVVIANATNVDWEDIAQDKKYIYIGDNGNNYGSRTNLKIYKVLKDDYLNSEKVIAEIINFSYSDQTTFSSTKKNNFDAEALVVVNDELVIFSKNRKDNQSKVYTLSKETGTHVAKQINTINVEGLITGAAINTDDNSIVLCGYGEGLSPFLIYLETLDTDSFVKINLIQSMGLGNQVEGIAHIQNSTYFLSREKVNKSLGGFTIKIPPAVFSFKLDKTTVPTIEIDKFVNQISNDQDEILSNKYNFNSVKISNISGNVIVQKSDSIGYIDKLPSGKYVLQIKVDEQIMVTKNIQVD